MTREDLFKNIRKVVHILKEIKGDENARHIMMCSHNTILAIKTTFKYEDEEYNNSSIQHVVDLRTPTNLKLIHTLDHHLDCPRFEPSVAKQWKSEDDLESSEDIILEKVLLSVKGLRELVKQEQINRLKFLLSLKKLSKETLLRF